jgi:hypothetical protein
MSLAIRNETANLVRHTQSFCRLGNMPTVAVGMLKRNPSGKNFMEGALMTTALAIFSPPSLD